MDAGEDSAVAAVNRAQVVWELLGLPRHRDIGAVELAIPLGDINGDGIVDIRDYGIWRQSFGQTNCGNPSDLNSDCIVDIRDYGIWRQHFGETSGGAARRVLGTPSAPIAPAPMSTPTPTSTQTLAPTSTPAPTRSSAKP